MKQFVFNNELEIPGNRVDDVAKIRDFIILEMDIQISLQDAYRLWNKISDYHCAGWLIVDFENWHSGAYEDPKEFLLGFMEKFGHIM